MSAAMPEVKMEEEPPKWMSFESGATPLQPCLLQEYLKVCRAVVDFRDTVGKVLIEKGLTMMSNKIAMISADVSSAVSLNVRSLNQDKAQKLTAVILSILAGITEIISSISTGSLEQDSTAIPTSATYQEGCPDQFQTEACELTCVPVSESSAPSLSSNELGAPGTPLKSFADDRADLVYVDHADNSCDASDAFDSAGAGNDWVDPDIVCNTQPEFIEDGLCKDSRYCLGDDVSDEHAKKSGAAHSVYPPSFRCENNDSIHSSNSTFFRKVGRPRKTRQCEVCLQTFIHRHTLLKHMSQCSKNENNDDIQSSTSTFLRKVGRPQKTRQCEVCLQTFVHRPTLLKHIIQCSKNGKTSVSSHIGEKPFKCRRCAAEFTSYYFLQKHRRSCLVKKASSDCMDRVGESTKMPEQPVSQTLDGSEVTTDRDITKDYFKSDQCPGQPHLSRVQQVLPTETEDTDPENVGENEAVMEIKTEIKDNSLTEESSPQRETLLDDMVCYTCDVCGKKLKQKSGLNTHMYVCHGKKPYQCPYCEVSFRFSHELKSHKDIHPAEQSFMCSACGKNFRHKGSLREHYKTQHTTQRQSYPCDQCDRIYATTQSLSHHKLVKHSDKPKPMCEVCGYVTDQPCKLRLHMRKHSDNPEDLTEKRFKCGICPKSFRAQVFLDVHMCTHTGEKPFNCEQCGTVFTSKGSLRRHKLIHDNVKPHVCPVCSKTFKERDYLYDHMQSHSKEKPYECNLCHTKFGHRRSFKQHMKRHGTEVIGVETKHSVREYALKLIAQVAHEKST